MKHLSNSCQFIARDTFHSFAGLVGALRMTKSNYNQHLRRITELRDLLEQEEAQLFSCVELEKAIKMRLQKLKLQEVA